MQIEVELPQPLSCHAAVLVFHHVGNPRIERHETVGPSVGGVATAMRFAGGSVSQPPQQQSLFGVTADGSPKPDDGKNVKAIPPRHSFVTAQILSNVGGPFQVRAGDSTEQPHRFAALDVGLEKADSRSPS